MNDDKILSIITEIKFNKDGLVPIIVQEEDSSEVLMMAWMNKEALEKTLETKQMHYFSRSRQKLWLKGETSKQFQELIELILDCDSDCLLAKIRQNGVACHTGRKSCFYKTIREGKFFINQSIIVNPDELYS